MMNSAERAGVSISLVDLIHLRCGVEVEVLGQAV